MPSQKINEVKIASAPLPIMPQNPDLFSINYTLNQVEEVVKTEKKQSLSVHFSQEDLDVIWKQFVEEIKAKGDISVYSAISEIKIKKESENGVLFEVTTESMKMVMEKLQSDFRKKMKLELKNEVCEFSYFINRTQTMQYKTKKQKFEELILKNHNLLLLHDYFKLDFNS